jgi:hypothetical protein
MDQPPGVAVDERQGGAPATPRERTTYTPPEDDAPLDAVEEALVRMWIDILLPLVCEGHS